MALRRIVLVRHGETEGNSSTRFHGMQDVALSPAGCAQMSAAGNLLCEETFDLVVSSPLSRSWRGAWIVGGGAPVRIVRDFREVNFGRWEGLTRDEIRSVDPVLSEEWNSGSETFCYPNGEARADFVKRVEASLDELLAEPAHSALCVLHKGVIRVIVRKLTGEELDAEEPELGGIIELSAQAQGQWVRGRRSSNPESLGQAEVRVAV